MSMYTVFSCVVGRGCLLWPVHSLGKTLLAFALLHLCSKAKFACYSRCFLTSYFCISVPYNEKDIFFWHFKRSCRSSLEKAMAPHSITLAWKVPWTEKPGRLPAIGSRRVGYDWATSLSLFTFLHWRRKWQPTPVFLPGESQGRESLVGCRLWGLTESGMTEVI